MTTRARLLLLTFAASMSLRSADLAISGVVLDSQTQRPLANARVLLAATTARGEKQEQVTKQDGRFAFSVNQAGKYTLQITKPGYPMQSYQQASFAGISSAIAVRDDQDTSHIVFLAKRGGAISGQVKDEDSEGVGNALVTVFQSRIVDGERKIVYWGQTRADATGKFRIPGMLRGSYYLCAMGRPWFADSLIQLEQTRGLPQRVDAVVPPVQFSPDPASRGTAFVATFYPRAQTVEEAALVRLDTGGEMQVTFTLPLTKAVTLKGGSPHRARSAQAAPVYSRKPTISTHSSWKRPFRRKEHWNSRMFRRDRMKLRGRRMPALARLVGTCSRTWKLERPTWTSRCDQPLWAP